MELTLHILITMQKRFHSLKVLLATVRIVTSIQVKFKHLPLIFFRMSFALYLLKECHAFSLRSLLFYRCG